MSLNHGTMDWSVIVTFPGHTNLRYKKTNVWKEFINENVSEYVLKKAIL